MKKFLLPIIALVAASNVYAWGSDITFKDLPDTTSIINPYAPEGLILNLQRNQHPAKFNLFTAERKNTGNLKNGTYYVHLFRKPYTFTQVCKLTVADWSSGYFSTNHHYCVKASG